MSSFIKHVTVFVVLLLTALYQCNGYCGNESPVAFSAQLSKDTKVSPNRVVVFDKTTVNKENGYDARTGEFKAPQPGLYMFTFTVSTRDWQKAQLVHNNVAKSFAEADTEKINARERSTATNTILLQVDKGDRVCVQITAAGGTLGGKLSSFTGVMI
uniref:C1q domain-containing protein n=1 Tax=Pinctada fucata TaxID=50426 RepID=A0A194APL2_PINFU